jgi:2-dehydro-3-deoxygluconokinase
MRKPAAPEAVMDYDLITLGEPLIEFNQTVPGQREYRQGFGGDTSNVAVAAARQGARAACLARIGDDDFGRLLLALWRREGVDARFVAIDAEAHTGVYFVTHDAQGHHFSYLRAGSAASRMTPRNLPLDAVARARWLHVSGIAQAISADAQATVTAAMALARASGVRISYDPNLRLRLWPLERARAAIEAAMPDADLFLPSLDEARMLSGAADIAGIFAWCFARGAGAVVLKCGADGAWIGEPGAALRHVAPFPAKPVDATGAGDCFDGSLIARLAAGDSLADAVRYANVAAALATQGWGAVEPVPTSAQVLAAMRG